MPQTPSCFASRVGAVIALGLLWLLTIGMACLPAQAGQPAPVEKSRADRREEVLLERGFFELYFPQGARIRTNAGVSDWPGGRYLFRAVDDQIVCGSRDLGTFVDIAPTNGGVKIGADKQARRLLLRINAGRIQVVRPADK